MRRRHLPSALGAGPYALSEAYLFYISVLSSAERYLPGVAPTAALKALEK